MATTEWAEWDALMDGCRFADSVAELLSGTDIESKAVADAYRDALNVALADCDAELHGEKIYGAAPKPEDWAELLREAIDSVDFWSIVKRIDSDAMQARDLRVELERAQHAVETVRDAQRDNARRRFAQGVAKSQK